MAYGNKRRGKYTKNRTKKIKLNDTINDEYDSDVTIETNDKKTEIVVRDKLEKVENNRIRTRSKYKLEEDKKIMTVEDLDNYKRVEERTMIVINKNKIATFSDQGLFKNTVKSKINTMYNYKDDNSETRKYILQKWELLPQSLRQLIIDEAEKYTRVDQTIFYDDLTAEEAFKLVFDDDIGTMVGFETIGHIAHLNIPSERLSIKKLIGKIILDKHKHIRTVINKRSELQNQFRTMDIEHLAGEKNYVAKLIENGLNFQIDFANVYWNSRLIQERNRIRDLLDSDDLLVDMFAGVGPFAIYAAKKGCCVFANDLNPVGAKYMEINAKLNKVQELVKVFNKDARDFISKVVKENKLLDTTVKVFEKMEFKAEKVHFIMNLPRIALEFLDVFVGLASNIKDNPLRKCMVHCYCFSAQKEYEEEIDERITRALGVKLKRYKITKVRNVAPSKQMYCVEFECPEEILRLNKYGIMK
ncbi:tRNA (guanine(37)-N(1))-methyltransferase [Theileria orientalis]|uniref:tRNA (guanine(37)-N1)-methyltransferase n=1 Tax=Theileria orientalis TaxID=68886 RepID=A0A976QWW0_THEOR|nr:tRNA (guanine(37)-N(1))-methyltransferase [Theileria orientalis]